MITTHSITLDQPGKKLALFGSGDRNLRLVREATGVKLVSRDNELQLSGEKQQVSKATAVLHAMQKTLRRKDFVSPDDVGDALRDAQLAEEGRPAFEVFDVFSRGQLIKPKTAGQLGYLKSIFGNDLIFCSGPAGSGKTYLAVAAAVHMLKRGQVKKIVLARPAVEAGERLGFLPGDLAAKVNPYLRPLFDALHDMMDFEHVRRLMAQDVIEVIPLAFMRGRTFNDSIVILDEAQNTTPSQMLMVLTRLGNDSKMIVTGDPSQTDLPKDQDSGLADALNRLDGTKGIAMVRLDELDIVRHPLVQRVIRAYADDGIAPGS